MSEKWKYSVRQHNAVDCFQARTYYSANQNSYKSG